MRYLLISTSIKDDETICFGPVYTTVRANHVWGYLKEIEHQFNSDKGLAGEAGVKLVPGEAKGPSEPLFGDAALYEFGQAVKDLLRRQYRERYEEPQNV